MSNQRSTRSEAATDASGFAKVDGFSRVIGLERAYASGDMPVKQGGIATQQADGRPKRSLPSGALISG